MFLFSRCNICCIPFSRTLGRRLNSRCYEQGVRRYSVDLAHHVNKGDTSLSNILIFHGLFGCKSNWATLAKRLTKDTGHTTVTVDTRNHGDSPHTDAMTFDLMGKDIRSLVVDKLGLSNCILIGHSMGGKVAMVTSLIEPSLVDKLIVVDSAPRQQRTSGGESWVMEYINAMLSVKFKENQSPSEMRKDVDLQLQKTIPEDAVRQFIMKNIRKNNTSFEWQLNLKALLDNHDDMIGFPEFQSTFPKPTLFVKGGHSDYILPSDHTEIFRLFPSATIETVEGAGHWVHSEKPNDFLQVVKRFLANKQE
ncbi:sn-1-specific diacylglycerol lipase ABHD11-like [Antedon mediterranea]|uniref:sn-1-specific diacylglycerol lipase ABHD11-like n=1 Tax=Antedon mediterranea TaxID=105859 RepID=UPI003AF76863